MRTVGFVLAMAALLAPSLSYSQARPASETPDAGTATTRPAEARAGDGDPVAPAARDRSLMGIVMDVLIASAEQQSARENASLRRNDAKTANAAQAATGPAMRAPVPVPPSPSSGSDLATREQVAVESQP